MTQLQSRSYERSSSFLRDAKAHADAIAIWGYSLLASIQEEVKNELIAIWDRPEVDISEKKTAMGVLPAALPIASEDEILAELKPVKISKKKLGKEYWGTTLDEITPAMKESGFEVTKE